MPLSAGHPCGRAARALRKAGHDPKVVKVGGRRFKPGSLERERQEIFDLTQQRLLPVLKLDDGSAIAGSNSIIKWAASHQN